MMTHTVAAVLLELAYLATGILLCYMGRKLLEIGVESNTRLEGEIHGNKWVLLTSSPGIVFALCGLGIIIYAIITPSEYEETLGQIAQRPQTVEISEAPATGKEIRSKLFEQLPGNARLISRVSIYSLLHRSKQLAEQDVQSLIAEMPTHADAELWPRTHDRFVDILKKNPSALAKILVNPEYEWLGIRDQQDNSLSAYLDLELERISGNLE